MQGLHDKVHDHLYCVGLNYRLPDQRVVETFFQPSDEMLPYIMMHI